MYITIEGCDGCGKDSQIETISNVLLDSGIKDENILIVNEPGSTETAEGLRELLLHSSGMEDALPLTEILMMSAARVDLMHRVINPFMVEKASQKLGLHEYAIIGNRSHLSSYVYQATRHPDAMQVYKAVTPAWVIEKPDVNIIINVDADVALGRLGETRDRLEQAEEEELRRRTHVYRSLCKVPYLGEAILAPQVIDLDGNQTLDDVTDELTTKLKEAIDNYKPGVWSKV